MGSRIVQISDTHILSGCLVTNHNAEQIVEFINDTLRPDLVVHTGDVVGLDPDHAGDRQAAAAALSRLQAPLLVVPGNHDVGDPGEQPWMGLELTSARIKEHNSVFGHVPFLQPFGDWAVLGLNSQVFGSGAPEEEEQWRWLEAELAASTARSVIAFLHLSVWPHDIGDPGEAPVTMNLSTSARERLLSLPGAERMRAIGHGHLHRYRRRQRDSVIEVAAPSVAGLGDTSEGAVGFPQPGVVEWTLDGESATTRFRAPTSLDEREFSDIPVMEARLEALVRLAQAASEQ